MHLKKRRKNFSYLNFFNKYFCCGSLGISFFASKNISMGKASYILISADPSEGGPTLVVVVVVYLKGISVSLSAVVDGMMFSRCFLSKIVYL